MSMSIRFFECMWNGVEQPTAEEYQRTHEVDPNASSIACAIA